MTPEEIRSTQLMNAGSVIEHEGTIISTKIVDNPVDEVDNFQNCYM